MTESQHQLDIDVQELLDALADEEKATRLMESRGWSKRDLLNRAHQLNKQLANTMSAVNVV